MRQDLLTESELVGDIDSFTDAQRKARATFIAHGLHLPREWVREDWEDGVGIDASPAGRVATGIYNAVVESGAFDPRFPNWGTLQMGSSFADIIKNGGDGLLWSLIRIGLEEAPDEDLAELCEERGFIVRRARRAAV